MDATSCFVVDVQGVEGPFGSGLTIEIKDTVVEGHEGVSEGSTEYLVFSSTLKGVAAAHGLHPVSNQPTALSKQ